MIILKLSWEFQVQDFEEDMIVVIVSLEVSQVYISI